MTKTGMTVAVALGALLVHGAPRAEEPVRLDEVSVTATRVERPTRTVPQSIAVIGKAEIEGQKMMNIEDALDGTPGVIIDSKNGGYDARLIIRGAGVKSRYGIREIMVLRDGVPMTDPDSFTRLDFIDTQDIEQIEVVKGPGSLYATGSAGGTIHIISKSVFEAENRLRIGLGNEGQELYHLRYGDMITENQALALSATRKVIDNDWRRWNRFRSNQASLKHGAFIGDGVLESEISYSEADLNLPGTMDRAQFAAFQRTGTQTETADPWKHSARDSRIWFGNIRYEQEIGNITLRPRAYLTRWEHFHPVTGFINVSDDNWIYGTDLEAVWAHGIFARPSTLAAGVTLRRDQSKDAKKYTYADVQTQAIVVRGRPVQRILATLSNDIGQLAQVQTTTNTLYGVFAQESVQVTERLLLDVGFRLDQSKFEIDTNELIGFDYSNNAYSTANAAGRGSTESDFTLFAPKIGLSYTVIPGANIYASAAQAGQVPSSSEVETNAGLDAAVSTNYEIGFKLRRSRFDLDAAIYYNTIKDDIVATRLNNQTTYLNAGKTRKLGFEIAGGYEVLAGLTLGGSYAYSDYEFEKFTEFVFGVGDVDRSGNALPLVPRHQYGLFADWNHPGGWKARIETSSFGEYWLDNANTEKYGGYDFVTNAMLGYEFGPHSLSLNVSNIFDEHYAAEAKKDLSGEVSFAAAAPRLWMATYRLVF